MRRKNDALQEEILACAKRLAASEGMDAINMRRIAQEAGIATGTLYNYYASKEEILLAMADEFWRATLEELDAAVTTPHFVDAMREIFGLLTGRMNDFRAGLLGSIRASGSGRVAEGKRRERAMQSAIRDAILRRLKADASIPAVVWTGAFTQEAFAAFAFAHLLMLLGGQPGDAAFFLELLSRTLYPTNDNKKENHEHGTGTAGNNL